MRFPRWSRRRQTEEDFEKELQHDLAMAVQDRMDRGETPEQARKSAVVEFGNVALVKEVTREAWGSAWIETLGQDIRSGLRILKKSPAFTAMVVLTLGLGIGANTAIFSVVNGVLLNPLPYRDPDRLVILSEHTTQRPDMSVSFPNYLDWRAMSRSFEQIAAFGPEVFTMTGRGPAERIEGRAVSASFLATLGVRPVLGRDFRTDDDRAGATPVVILSYSLWERLGGDETLVGQGLDLSGSICTVIGILPRSSRFYYGEPEILFPLGQAMDREQAVNRDNHSSLYAVGRLRRGVPLERARAELIAIARRLEQAHPETNSGHGVMVATLYRNLLGEIQPLMLVLLAGAGLVLLIACANVGNLLLARAASREKEISIRQALGASPRRILRQLLTESLLLAMLGGGCGILLAGWGVDSLSMLLPHGVPRLSEVRLDARVLLFAVSLSSFTGLWFGLAPAWETFRRGSSLRLQELGRGTGESLRKRHLRNTMVVCQVALALVLSIGAGLTTKSFARLLRVQPGFDPRNVLTLQIPLENKKYFDRAQTEVFFRQLIESVDAIPGVRSAALVAPLVFSGEGWQNDFYIEGRPVPKPGEFPNSDFQVIGPGYFRTMAIPLVQGRAFDDFDQAASQPVVIINQEMASKYWPGTNPLGKRMHLGSPDDGNPWLKIIGVVGDVKQYSLDQGFKTQFYLPFTQRLIRFRTIVIRAEREPAGLTKVVQAIVGALDKDQPVTKVHPLESMLSDSIGPRRTAVVLLGLFSSLAIVLAAIGIYGVASYGVSRRKGEFGLRMALGARRRDILRLVLGEGSRIALAGVLVGLLGAFLLTRFMSSVLFRVGPMDPETYATLAVGLGCVALFACYWPARRATRTDPIVALRNE